MLKRLTWIVLIALGSACGKLSDHPGCKTQICTQIFATIGINFTDNTGKPIGVIDFNAMNQRTHLKLLRTIPQNEMLMIGYYVVADDGMKSQLSTEGDDILITATNPATHQTKTVTLKVSGGCNCHVAKISGPDTVAFD